MGEMIESGGIDSSLFPEDEKFDGEWKTVGKIGNAVKSSEPENVEIQTEEEEPVAAPTAIPSSPPPTSGTPDGEWKTVGTVKADSTKNAMLKPAGKAVVENAVTQARAQQPDKNKFPAIPKEIADFKPDPEAERMIGEGDIAANTSLYSYMRGLTNYYYGSVDAVKQKELEVETQAKQFYEEFGENAEALSVKITAEKEKLDIDYEQKVLKLNEKMSKLDEAIKSAKTDEEKKAATDAYNAEVQNHNKELEVINKEFDAKKTELKNKVTQEGSKLEEAYKSSIDKLNEDVKGWDYEKEKEAGKILTPDQVKTIKTTIQGMPNDYEGKKRMLDRFVKNLLDTYDGTDQYDQVRDELYDIIREEVLFDKDNQPTPYALKNQAEIGKRGMANEYNRLNAKFAELTKGIAYLKQGPQGYDSFIAALPSVPGASELYKKIGYLQRAIGNFDRVSNLPQSSIEGKKKGTYFGGMFSVDDLAKNTVTAGLFSMLESAETVQLALKQKNGIPLTKEEQKYVDSMALLESTVKIMNPDLDIWYKAGRATGESLPWITSMMFSNPAYNVAKLAAMRALGSTGAKVGSKWAAKEIGKVILAEAVGSAARIPVQPAFYQNIAEGLVETKAEWGTGGLEGKLSETGRSTAGAVGRAVYMSWAENISEISGTYITSAGKSVLAKAASKVGIKAASKIKLPKLLGGKFSDVTKVSNMPAEYAEEILASVMHLADGSTPVPESLTPTMIKELGTVEGREQWKSAAAQDWSRIKEEQLVTFLSVATMVGGMQVVSGTLKGVGSLITKQEMVEGLAEYFSQQQISEVDKINEITDVNQKAKALFDFIQSNKVAGADPLQELARYVWDGQVKAGATAAASPEPGLPDTAPKYTVGEKPSDEETVKELIGDAKTPDQLAGIKIENNPEMELELSTKFKTLQENENFTAALEGVTDQDEIDKITEAHTVALEKIDEEREAGLAKIEEKTQTVKPEPVEKLAEKPLYQSADEVRSDVEHISNKLKTFAFRNKPFNGLSVDVQNTVKSSMLSLADDDKVRRAVVSLVPIDVMDSFGIENFSVERFLSDPSMFKEILSSDDNGAIERFFDSLAGGLAGVGTVFPSGSTAGDNKTSPATGANELDLIKSFEGVEAFNRAKNALADFRGRPDDLVSAINALRSYDSSPPLEKVVTGPAAKEPASPSDRGGKGLKGSSAEPTSNINHGEPELKDKDNEKGVKQQQEVTKSEQKKTTVKPAEPSFQAMREELGITDTKVQESMEGDVFSGRVKFVDVILAAGKKAGDVVIESMRTPKLFRKMGRATKALAKITEAADKQGITLRLIAKPEEKSGVTEEQLINFYKKNGFKFKEGSNEGVRAPWDPNIKVNEQAKKEFERLSANAEGALPSKWVATQDDLPKNIRDKAMSENPRLKKRGSIDGVYDPKSGKVYFVADQINSKDDVARVWLHEQVGHHGIDLVYPNKKDRDAFHEEVFRSVGLDKIRKVVSPSEMRIFEGSDKGAKARIRLADEYVAYLTNKVINKEKLTVEEKSAWQKILDIVRKAWAKLYGKAPVNTLSDDDIARVLNKALAEVYKKKGAQDAVQEQEAGGVPVQPETGTGERVEKGTSETKPEKTPGKEERLSTAEKIETDAELIGKNINFVNYEERRDRGYKAVPRESSSASQELGERVIAEGGFRERSVGEVRRVGERDVNVVRSFSPEAGTISAIKQQFPEAFIDDEIFEITGEAESFHYFISKAKLNNKYGASVYVYSQGEYKAMRLFISPDGNVGFAIKPDGDFVSAFSSSTAGKKYRIPTVMLLGIKLGGIKLDCFNTILPNYYSMFGFRAVSKVQFDPEYAPEPYKDEHGFSHEGWDYERFSPWQSGKPDVVYFVYDGGELGSIEKRIGKFSPYSPHVENTLEYSSMDEAGEIQLEAIGRFKQLGKTEEEEGEPRLSMAPETVIAKAKEYFGVTTNFKEVGYITPDGAMLDFSGKKFGGSPGRRTMDHSEIGEMGVSRKEFMNMGNIRMYPEVGGINLMERPTPQQRVTLQKFIQVNDGNIYVDFNTPNSYYSEHAVQYDKQRASKILGDIDNYYLKGIKPQSSPKFADDMRFSMPDKIEVDGKMRPTKNNFGRFIADTEEKVRNFYKWFGNSQVTDTQGRPLVVYHGSYDKFTAFNDNLNFFSENEYVASSYGDNETLYPVYLKLENPLDLRGKTHVRNIAYTDKDLIKNVKAAIESLPDDYVTKTAYAKVTKDQTKGYLLKEAHGIEYIDHNYFPLVWDAIYNWAKGNGYDGWFHNDESFDKLVQFAPSFATFTNKQQKSASENIGAFSAENADIRFSVGETIEVDGINRPTTNSEGRLIHPTEEGIRNFWRWFLDSVTVNKKGQPIIFTHNTDTEFTEFDPNKAGARTDKGWYGRGFYFTTYGDTHYGNIEMGVYLKIENPYYKKESHRNYELDSEKLISDGHDGVIVYPSFHEFDKDNPTSKIAEVVVYNPEQIKSATDNTGKFSEWDADIRFSEKTPAESLIQQSLRRLVKGDLITKGERATLADKLKDFIAAAPTTKKPQELADEAYAFLNELLKIKFLKRQEKELEAGFKGKMKEQKERQKMIAKNLKELSSIITQALGNIRRDEKQMITPGQYRAIINRLGNADTVRKMQALLDYVFDTVILGKGAKYKAELAIAKKWQGKIGDKNGGEKSQFGSAREIADRVENIDLKELSYEELQEFSEIASGMFLSQRNPSIAHLTLLDHRFGDIQKVKREKEEPTPESATEIIEAVGKMDTQDIVDIPSYLTFRRRLNSYAKKIKELFADMNPDLAQELEEQYELEIDGIEEMVNKQLEAFREGLENFRKAHAVHLARRLKQKETRDGAELLETQEERDAANELIDTQTKDIMGLDINLLAELETAIKNLREGHITPAFFDIKRAVRISHKKRLTFLPGFDIVGKDKTGIWARRRKKGGRRGVQTLVPKSLRKNDLFKELVRQFKSKQPFRMDMFLGIFDEVKKLSKAFTETGRAITLAETDKQKFDKAAGIAYQEFQKGKTAKEQERWRKWIFLYKAMIRWQNSKYAEKNPNLFHMVFEKLYEVERTKVDDPTGFDEDAAYYKTFMDFMREKGGLTAPDAEGVETLNEAEADRVMREDAGVAALLDWSDKIVEQYKGMNKVSALYNGRSLIWGDFYVPFMRKYKNDNLESESNIESWINRSMFNANFVAGSTYEWSGNPMYMEMDIMRVMSLYSEMMRRNYFIYPELRENVTALKEAARAVSREIIEKNADRKDNDIYLLGRALAEALRSRISSYYNSNYMIDQSVILKKAEVAIKKTMLVKIEKFLSEFSVNISRIMLATMNIPAADLERLVKKYDFWGNEINSWVNKGMWSAYSTEINYKLIGSVLGSGWVRRTAKGAEQVADWMIKAPDMGAGRILFVHSMTRKFKELTGEEFSEDKWKESRSYRQKWSDAKEESMYFANTRVEELFNSKNPLSEGELKSFLGGLLKADRRNAMARSFSMLMSFGQNDSNQIVDSFRRIRHGGPKARLRAVRDINALFMSNFMYAVVRAWTGVVAYQHMYKPIFDSISDTLIASVATPGGGDDEWEKVMEEIEAKDEEYMDKKANVFKKGDYYLDLLKFRIGPDFLLGGSSNIVEYGGKWLVWAYDRTYGLSDDTRQAISDAFYQRYIMLIPHTWNDPEKVLMRAIPPMWETAFEDAISFAHSLSDFTRGHIATSIIGAVFDVEESGGMTKKEVYDLLNLWFTASKYLMFFHPGIPIAEREIRRELRGLNKAAREMKKAKKSSGTQDASEPVVIKPVGF